MYAIRFITSFFWCMFVVHLFPYSLLTRLRPLVAVYVTHFSFLFPFRPAVAYVGDGAWGMSLNEVLTCVREKIPTTAVVFHNKQWGAEKKNQVLWFGDRCEPRTLTAFPFIFYFVSICFPLEVSSCVYPHAFLFSLSSLSIFCCLFLLSVCFCLSLRRGVFVGLFLMLVSPSCFSLFLPLIV